MPEKDSLLTKEVGRRIQSRRKQLHLTQEQLAERADLSQQFIGCVESGSKGLGDESIIKLSQALQVSADYILFGHSGAQDRNRIAELVKPLNGEQVMWLEDIIKAYLKGCGYLSDPDTP